MHNPRNKFPFVVRPESMLNKCGALPGDCDFVTDAGLRCSQSSAPSLTRSVPVGVVDGSFVQAGVVCQDACFSLSKRRAVDGIDVHGLRVGKKQCVSASADDAANAPTVVQLGGRISDQQVGAHVKRAKTRSAEVCGREVCPSAYGPMVPRGLEPTAALPAVPAAIRAQLSQTPSPLFYSEAANVHVVLDFSSGRIVPPAIRGNVRVHMSLPARFVTHAKRSATEMGNAFESVPKIPMHASPIPIQPVPPQCPAAPTMFFAGPLSHDGVPGVSAQRPYANDHEARTSAAAARRVDARRTFLQQAGRATLNQYPVARGPPSEYQSFRPCDCVCRHCHARFWYEERLSMSTRRSGPLYNRCCRGGSVRLLIPSDYPQYVKELFSDAHFMNNVRAYNQMFSMTSLGATVDETVNNGRGPYVFKVSGHIYHCIGRLCPETGKDPRFLQLYIYDTYHEVDNRLSHFRSGHGGGLRRDIVEGLIQVLDEHNALVQLFRCARDKLREADVPAFKVRLYNVVGAPQYELPTADCIGAIVFEDGPHSESEFDIIIESHSGDAQRVNKLHPCYMAFHLPLLFVYGEQGYHTGLRLAGEQVAEDNEDKRVTMHQYYSYMTHDRPNKYGLLMRGGRLFQQYVVMAYCCMEQSRMDYIRMHQSDIRGEFLSGVYDAVARGDREGSDVGSRIILPASFTGGPRYMYSHYLDALAICRVHGNPSFFVTFTCNVRWPEIETTCVRSRT